MSTKKLFSVQITFHSDDSFEEEVYALDANEARSIAKESFCQVYSESIDDADIVAGKATAKTCEDCGCYITEKDNDYDYCNDCASYDLEDRREEYYASQQAMYDDCYALPNDPYDMGR